MELITVSSVLVPATAAFQGQQPYDLVSLAAVKTELNLSDSSKDALLKGYITQASAAAANFCDRVFPIETVLDQIFPPRDYFPAPTVIGGLKPLQLSRRPIASTPANAGTEPPVAPVLSAVGGGALAAATYFVRITYVTPQGETEASAEAFLSVAADNLLAVVSPAADSASIATGWNVYAGTKSQGEIKQNVAPIALGAAFTLPTSGLVTSGSPPPSAILVIENSVPLAEGVDFLVKYDVGQLVRLDTNGWPKRWPALITTAQYQAGYALSDPTLADLFDGVIRYVKGRYFAQPRDPALRQENIAGAYEAAYWFAAGPGAAVGNLPPDIQALWEKYRTPVIG